VHAANKRKDKPVDKNIITFERLEIPKHVSYLEINKMANVVCFPGARTAGSRSATLIPFYCQSYECVELYLL